MSLYTQLLQDPYAIRRYLVIAHPYDDRTSPTPGVIDLYFSEDGFITEPSDTPSNVYFEPRISQALSFKSEIIDKNRVRGEVTPSYGDIVLSDGDAMGTDPSSEGTLDYLDDLYWHGRKIEVKLGGVLSDGTVLGYSDYGQVGLFLAEGLDSSTEEKRIRIRDPRLVLDKDFLTSKYAGTGGYEGGDSLKGRWKPRAIGWCRFVTPVYLGVIGGLHTFQVNDGEVNDIPQVYSNVSPLTRVDSSPAAGQFSVDRERGTFQLGGSDLDTIITCDIYGLMDNSSGSPSNYLRYPGEICQYIADVIADAPSVTGMTSDTSSAQALDAAAPYVVGIYVDGQRSCGDVMSEVMSSVSGYFGYNRSGRLTFGRVTAPGTPVGEFTQVEILGSPERLATVPPSKQIIVGHSKCWTVHTFDKIAVAVSEENREFVQDQFRSEPSTNVPEFVQELFPLALEERYDTLLTSAADAQAEADRLQDLYGVVRKVWQVTVKTQPFQFDLGDTVRITDDRLGLSSGLDCVIIGMEEQSGIGEVTMTLWA